MEMEKNKVNSRRFLCTNFISMTFHRDGLIGLLFLKKPDYLFPLCAMIQE